MIQQVETAPARNGTSGNVVLINIIKRKQKTLYNMTYAHYRNILYDIGPPWERVIITDLKIKLDSASYCFRAMVFEARDF